MPLSRWLLPPVVLVLRWSWTSALLLNAPANKFNSRSSQEVSGNGLDADEDSSIISKPSLHLPEKFKSLMANQENQTAKQISDDNLNLKVSGGSDNFYSVPLPKMSASLADPKEATAPIKMIVWTPILTWQWDVQKAHVDTWMKQPYVCHISRRAESGCRVFPVWVYGNVSVDQRKNVSAIAGDLVHTVFFEDIVEPIDQTYRFSNNMNLKTPHFMEHAYTNFQWATHVSRLDADAFPYMDRILKDLEQLPRHGLVYGPMDRLKDEAHATSTHCSNRLIQGHFSVISQDVSRCVFEFQSQQLEAYRYAKNGASLVKKWSFPGEDAVFSYLMFDAQSYGQCPRLTCVHTLYARRVEHPV